MHDISLLPADVRHEGAQTNGAGSRLHPERLKQQRALKDLGIALVIGELEDGRTIRSWSGGGFCVRAA